MTAPSIREALCEARPYVAELATFSPSGARHRELLQRIDAALSTTPPQDVVEGIARTVTSELEQMHKDGVQMCMRDGETTWRTYHAGFDLSMFAQRISDAILASGLVTENKNWKTSPEILLDQIAALRDEYQRLRRDCLDQLEWHAGQGNSEDAGEFSTEAERHAAALLACNRILKLVSNFKA